MTRQDMRFGVVRDKRAVGEEIYIRDGNSCPSCNRPTESATDPLRRYCTNTKCNAMVLREHHTKAGEETG